MHTFVPEIGQLCVHTTVSDTNIELLYWYRDSSDPLHFRVICVMSEFQVHPVDSGRILTAAEIASIQGTIQTPVAIHNHLCTWQELQAIKKLWHTKPEGSKKYFLGFSSWMLKIMNDQSIPTQLKDRLLQIA
jgi:hypothetical protein